MTSKIPTNLQGVLWSVDINNFDFIKNKAYVIHQVLAYGTWDHLVWLFKNYTINEIRESFEKYPEKDYTPQGYNFSKNVLLEISKPLDEKRYVKTFPRYIRQQKTRSI